MKNKASKNTNVFNNNQLKFDTEKHLIADDITIEKWGENIEGELQYNVRVNDDVYFYFNESERDFDYAMANSLFNSPYKN